MQPLVFISPVILTFIIFLIPPKIREVYAALLTVFIAILTSVPAVDGLFKTVQFSISPGDHDLVFTIDRLTAFFILVTNFTAVTGIFVSGGIMKPYGKSPVQDALNYFSYTWLHLSMLGLLMFREGIPFLIAWELMAVSSFMLILYDAENRATLKTAVNYLVQMHIGLVLLVIALLMVWKATGHMSFNALTMYFAGHSNAGLFLLFFAGFAMKAGFVPFHTWLPEAHPAAPSHVSGFMSGVMIKMGIYGILRVVFNLQADIYLLGVIVLIISAVTGLFGIMLAIVQRDLKRMLAYSSIENIGIIGMGIGTGMMGWGSLNQAMMILGFGGAFLHIVNHSLVKSLLFFSTGTLYAQYHTRNMEELGGVTRRMPVTSALFLTGSLAICSLPPTGSFISELLILAGMIFGFSGGGSFQLLLMLAAIIALVLTGGLSVFAFSKAFGITFSGTPRKEHHNISEGSTRLLIPQIVVAVLIILTGIFPVIWYSPLLEISGLSAGNIPILSGIILKTTLVSSLLIVMILLIFLIRKILSGNQEPGEGPVWGCGYTAATPKIQYTATSYAGNFAALAAPVIPVQKDTERIQTEEIFPRPRSRVTRPLDFFRRAVFRITDGFMWLLKYLARLQTGHIQHYILYAFVFILIIFFLLYLKVL